MKFSVKQHIGPGENILTHSVLLVIVSLNPPWWIAVTVNNPCSACFIGLHVGQISQETFGWALTSRWFVQTRASMLLSSSISDSFSASQSSLLAFGLSKSPFKLSQFLVLEMHSGEISSALWTGWWLILLIWRTFNAWVCPPGRSSADKGGGKDDLSDNLKAATPSY